MDLLDDGNLAENMDLEEEIETEGFFETESDDEDISDLEEISQEELESEVEQDFQAGFVSDALKAYFKDVSRFKLLTQSEETELAKRVVLGDISARNKMIESNLRLVISIAKKFMNRGIPLADLINEGNLGLMTAVEKFSIHKGCRFSTHATWWIRQNIHRSLATSSRVVRLPVHVSDGVNKLSWEIKKMRMLLGKEPTISEISAQLRISEKEVSRLLICAQGTCSFDLQMPDAGNGDESALGDRLASDAFASVETQAIARNWEECRLRIMMKKLSLRERAILSVRMRDWESISEYLKHEKWAFGIIDTIKNHFEIGRIGISALETEIFFGIRSGERLDFEKEEKIMVTLATLFPKSDGLKFFWWLGCGGETMTLENVGYFMGLTRERIRQIEKEYRLKFEKQISALEWKGCEKILEDAIDRKQESISRNVRINPAEKIERFSEQSVQKKLSEKNEKDNLLDEFAEFLKNSNAHYIDVSQKLGMCLKDGISRERILAKTKGTVQWFNSHFSLLRLCPAARMVIRGDTDRKGEPLLERKAAVMISKVSCGNTQFRIAEACVRKNLRTRFQVEVRMSMILKEDAIRRKAKEKS